MKRFSRALAVSLLAGIAAGQPAADQNHPAVAPVNEPARAPAPKIQVAILLDTSGSMDGLIEQAKTQLWTIVNELASTTQGGQRPEIYVSLFEYGKQTLAPDEGYLRMILPLSRDLDAVSQELFSLQTNGGDEYCGWVIRAATQGLDWSPESNVLKMIVIAGNEPFSQGTVDFHQTVPEAIAKGIIVNTIFCGDRQEGINTGWQEGALLADGSFSHIDQNLAVESIPSPQDAELQALNAELNTTYIAYGADGERGREEQVRQDANAMAPGSAGAGILADRAVSKSQSWAYCNTAWDLVDACREKVVDLATLEDAQLPEAMRGKTLEEKKAYVAGFTEKRAKIQSRILELGEERERFIAAARRERAEGAGQTLAEVLCEAVRAQAAKRGFEPDAKE
ncbi:MAG: VWA domain-containing protein [Phycisphaerales bacterium]|nr:VWA domain-containing protein [Phycisphaerales bacterium]